MLAVRWPSGEKELTVPGHYGTGGIVLPGDDAHVGDATPELEDLGARSRRRRTGRAQVVDAEGDRLRHALAARVVDQPHQRRELEESAEHAAVHGRQRGVADDLLPEREDALERVAAVLDLDAEETGVGDDLEDAVHRASSFRVRTSRWKPLSLRLAPSMKVPGALAQGS